MKRAALAFAAVAIIVLPVVKARTQTAAPARQLPARTLPVPNTVSPEMQALIAAAPAATWNVAPTSIEEWKTMSAPSSGRGLPALRERFGVKTESLTVNGVPAYMITPNAIPPGSRNRLLVHAHGGCYVLNGGEAATTEAIYMAGIGHFKVLSIDYRRPPEFPYPGDMRGFPPAILTTGTRDLLLSNTVRVHRKLQQAGVVADLHVYEGQSHAQYMRDANAPETKEAFEEIARFFDRHLGL